MQDPNTNYGISARYNEEESIFPFTSNEQASYSKQASEHASAQYEFVCRAGMPRTTTPSDQG